MAREKLSSSGPVIPRGPEHFRPSLPSETLTTGKEVVARLIGMIGEAKHSIDLQFYTFEADSTGKKVLSALAVAKRENPDLKIRLLVDNSISLRHDGKFIAGNGDAQKKRDETYQLLNEMKDEGTLEDVKVTNWFPQNPIVSSLHLFSNVLHRDHKKLVTIDARDLQNHPDANPMALITSVNIAQYHENDRKEVGRVYHGTEGPVPFIANDFEQTFHNAQEWERVYSVRSVKEYFKKYGLSWDVFIDGYRSIVRNPEKPGQRFVYEEGPKGHDSAVLTDSFFPKWFFRRGAREATDELFSMLTLAKPGETVVAFTPYPGIWSLTRRLNRAAKRGVDTHLIISQNYENELFNPIDPKSFGDRVFQPFFAGWPRRITKHGVVLHEYVGKKDGLKGELHAKGAVWIREDGSARTLIGSTNFSKGPFSGMNREIAVVEESDASDPLVKYAQDLMADSEIVSREKPYLRRTRAAKSK
ncbi:MAG TPA: phospholipase D-like domain-containing protein [Candidatus Eisenbacteria bacterium]|nr:phospholipase D-like domain-containing protein [Candidatus Eisenbacteria bacterium]